MSPVIELIGQGSRRRLVYFIFMQSDGIVKLVRPLCSLWKSHPAKVVIVGGFDNPSEEGPYDFPDMKATGNAETEFAKS